VSALRLRCPLRTLRIICLAAAFLACRFIFQLGVVPTLFVTFSVRWFVVTPLPRAKRQSASSKRPTTTAGGSPTTA